MSAQEMTRNRIRNDLKRIGMFLSLNEESDFVDLTAVASILHTSKQYIARIHELKEVIKELRGEIEELKAMRN